MGKKENEHLTKQEVRETLDYADSLLARAKEASKLSADKAILSQHNEIRRLNRKISELEEYSGSVKRDYRDALSELDDLEKDYQDLLKEKHGSIGWQISVYRDALNKIRVHVVAGRKQVSVGSPLILGIIKNAFKKTGQPTKQDVS